MPKADVIFYREGERVPILDWLEECARRDKSVVTKCWERIRRLQLEGASLRRPVADYLDDGIYELRISHKNQNYRILYCFVGQNVALLTHGIMKERRVPPSEIALAVKRKRRFEENPADHIYKEF